MATAKHSALVSPSPCDHLRCECGSLLARFIDGKVELKCRRCKRTVMIPVEEVSNE